MTIWIYTRSGIDWRPINFHGLRSWYIYIYRLVSLINLIYVHETFLFFFSKPSTATIVCTLVYGPYTYTLQIATAGAVRKGSPWYCKCISSRSMRWMDWYRSINLFLGDIWYLFVYRLDRHKKIKIDKFSQPHSFIALAGESDSGDPISSLAIVGGGGCRIPTLQACQRPLHVPPTFSRFRRWYRRGASSKRRERQCSCIPGYQDGWHDLSEVEETWTLGMIMIICFIYKCFLYHEKTIYIYIYASIRTLGV